MVPMPWDPKGIRLSLKVGNAETKTLHNIYCWWMHPTEPEMNGWAAEPVVIDTDKNNSNSEIMIILVSDSELSAEYTFAHLSLAVRVPWGYDFHELHFCRWGNWSSERLSNLPQIRQREFPGGTADKNLPANAGGYRFDPWSGKIPHAEEHTKPVYHNYWACAPLKEKLPQWAAGTSQQRVALTHRSQRKACPATRVQQSQTK